MLLVTFVETMLVRSFSVVPFGPEFDKFVKLLGFCTSINL